MECRQKNEIKKKRFSSVEDTNINGCVTSALFRV